MNRSQGIILLSILTVACAAFFLQKTLEPEQQQTTKGSPISRKEKKDGIVKQYTTDNRLKTAVNYKNGVKHGVSYLYHTDGETVLLEMPYKNGKRDGTSKKYYESGEVYATTQYKNDEIHGLRKTYYSNGQPKAEVHYAYGYPGIGTREYFIDGSAKTPNEIVFEKRNELYFPKTKEQCAGTRFYIGKLIEDRFYYLLDKNLKAMPVIDGEYFIDPKVFTPSFLEYQDIVCYCESSQGNPIVLKKKLIID